MLALPTLWLVSRDESREGAGAPAVAAVGAGGAVPGTPTGPGGAVDATDIAADVDTGVTVEPPVFLEGPPASPAPAVIDIAVPDSHPAASAAGAAGYVRYGTSTRCDTPHAPANAEVTVTNLNNGRSVTCRNWVTAPLAAGTVVILDVAVFLQIADLVDAPVPVRIVW